jgi:ArsR family transcriptional regulator
MKDLTRVFKALSDPTRLRILKMLEARPLCVCEITAVLGLATSTVSKHLSILRDAGLILDEKENKWVNYRLNRGARDAYGRQLLPLVKKWLAEDPVILKDAKTVKTVNRENLCAR